MKVCVLPDQTEPESRKKRQNQFTKKFLVLAYLTRSTAQTLQADEEKESQDLAGINAPWPIDWTISMVHSTAANNCFYSPVNPT